MGQMGSNDVHTPILDAVHTRDGQAGPENRESTRRAQELTHVRAERLSAALCSVARAGPPGLRAGRLRSGTRGGEQARAPRGAGRRVYQGRLEGVRRGYGSVRVLTRVRGARTYTSHDGSGSTRRRITAASQL